MPGFDALIEASWRERGFGDFWGYSLVAEGAAEVMLEVGMKVWDLAAPLVVIEEAGGGHRRGWRAPLRRASFVGSNGILHDAILRRRARRVRRRLRARR